MHEALVDANGLIVRCQGPRRISHASMDPCFIGAKSGELPGLFLRSSVGQVLENADGFFVADQVSDYLGPA